MTSSIEYRLGVPKSLQRDAAVLFDSAFGEKFAVAVPSQDARIDLLEQSLVLPFAFSAIHEGVLAGLAGFHSAIGSFTGGMTYRQLVASLGLIRGNRAALVFGLYERQPAESELLMDGIAVHPEMRGRGIGTRLLEELTSYARREGYDQVRLDVIDTNPGARRLYERHGFVARRTERFGYLRWLLGFGASTTMIRDVTKSA